MGTYYQQGDAIKGEKIAFQCRKLNRLAKPIHATSAHRAQAGKLINAYCVIDKRFRNIPEKREK